MKDFIVTKYHIDTSKLRSHISMCVLCDLHGKEYGRKNERLIKAVSDLSCDIILIPGDLITYGYPETLKVAYTLVKRLSLIAPVYFSNGNHEMRSSQSDYPYHRQYLAMARKLQKKYHVTFLNNRSKTISVGADRLTLTGLDLPKPYFNRFSSTKMPLDVLKYYTGGISDTSGYNILLAHTPQYAKTYAACGYDLILSGHYHGGLICLPHIGSIISPSFHLFPKYSFGDSVIGDSHIITSRGLGTHRYNIRINNPAELIFITLN